MTLPRWLHTLRQLGVERATDPRQAQRILLTNAISLTVGAITLPYAVIFGLMGALALAVAVVPIAAVYAGVPLYTRWFSFTAARAVMFTMFPTAITIYISCFGENSGIQLLYFAAVCLPILLSDVGERRLLAYGIAMPMLGYAIVEASGYQLFGAPVVGPVVQDVIRYVLVPTTFAILLCAILYFAISQRAAEARLDARNGAMRLLLDHVDQGFCTIDARGVLRAERSSAIDRWLGAPRDGETFGVWLGRVDAQAGAWFEAGIDQVSEELVPLELALDQLPKGFRHAGRSFSLAYKSIPGPSLQLLVVVTDVTADVERARAEQEQRDLVQLVQRVVREPSAARGFFEEAQRLTGRITAREGDSTQLFREVHTLKGNAALFGLEGLAQLCHEVESRLRETGELPTDDDVRAIERSWSALAQATLPLLGGHGAVTVRADELARLRAEIVAFRAPHELVRIVDGWTGLPVRTQLERFADEARRLARRLGKGALEVEIRCEPLRLPERFGPLLGSLVHVVRNAVDHGLEAGEARGAKGAPRVVFAAHRDAAGVTLEVIDDGHGIDWSGVARKARQRGLSADTRDDLVRALFADGLSTAAEVTEYSGRGVGLSAVRAEAEAVGAAIDVRSEAGRGTTFALRIPLEQTPTRAAA